MTVRTQRRTRTQQADATVDTTPAPTFVSLTGLPMNDGDSIALARILAKASQDVTMSDELRSLANRLAMRALAGELLYKVDD